jgi:hypothetical protein
MYDFNFIDDIQSCSPVINQVKTYYSSPCFNKKWNEYSPPKKGSCKQIW